MNQGIFIGINPTAAGLTLEEAQAMKDRLLETWPELKTYTEKDAPAPSPGPDCRPRKSRYGRAPNVRHFDRNKQAAARVRGQLAIKGKLLYPT